MYARVAKFIGSRKDLTEDKLEELEEIVQDSAKAAAIIEAARVSMGKREVILREFQWVRERLY